MRGFTDKMTVLGYRGVKLEKRQTINNGDTEWMVDSGRSVNSEPRTITHRPGREGAPFVPSTRSATTSITPPTTIRRCI